MGVAHNLQGFMDLQGSLMLDPRMGPKLFMVVF